MAIPFEVKMKEFINGSRADMLKAGIPAEEIDVCIREALGLPSLDALGDMPPLGDFERAHYAIRHYILTHCPRKLLNLDRIGLDGGTQTRAAQNQDVIDEYAHDYGDPKNKIAAITVFFDGQDYWLADGFHRVAALQKLGRLEAWVEVLHGTLREAILYSCGANARHGLRRTNADKRNAVLKLLRDEEWQLWSDHEIARHCGVAVKTVGNIRRDLHEHDSTMKIPQLRKGADGRSTNIANIGKTLGESGSVSPQSSRPRPPKGPSEPIEVDNEFGLIRNQYYPTNHERDLIYNDPFPHQVPEDLDGTPYDNCYLLSGDALNGDSWFSDYQVVEALRSIPNPDMRYRPGMKARCEICSKRERRDVVHANWQVAPEHGKWRCPNCGFVRPDLLLDIVQDEAAKPQLPSPRPKRGNGSVVEKLIPGYEEVRSVHPEFADLLLNLGQAHGWIVPQKVAAAFLPILRDYRQYVAERDEYAQQLREIAS